MRLIYNYFNLLICSNKNQIIKILSSFYNTGLTKISKMPVYHDNRIEIDPTRPVNGRINPVRIQQNPSNNNNRYNREETARKKKERYSRIWYS